MQNIRPAMASGYMPSPGMGRVAAGDGGEMPRPGIPRGCTFASRFVHAARIGRRGSIRTLAIGADYLIGAIKCWYGVPAHITYGAAVSGSGFFG
ncbi:hypothetical protein GCM10027065_22180 [Rhodanobacter koreensis]